MNKNYSIFKTINKTIFLIKKESKENYINIFFLNFIGIASELITLSLLYSFLGIIGSGSIKNNLIKGIFNNFNIYGDKNIILGLSILLIFIVGITTYIKIYSFRYIELSAAKVSSRVSNKIFSNILYQEYEDFLEEDSSKIINLIVKETGNFSNVVSGVLNLFSTTLLVLSLFVFLLKVNFLISIISIIYICFLYFLTTQYSSKRLEEINSTFLESGKKEIKIIKESLNIFREIKINSVYNNFINDHRSTNTEIRKKHAKYNFLVLFPKFIIEFLAILLIVVICLFWAISNGSTSELLSSVGILGFSIIKIIPNLQQSYRSWSVLKVSSISIDTIFKYYHKVNNKNNKSQLKNLKNFSSLEFSSISFVYRNAQKKKNFRISDLNLRIEKGDSIIIYGPSGSGKSTLLDLISGLIKPTSGDIKINNRIADQNLMKSIRKKISYMSQETYLISDSIGSNIDFSNKSSNWNLNKMKLVSKIAMIDDLINSKNLGYNTYVGDGGLSLSGGQKQRICIARTLYNEKDIVILDEATSSIDKELEKIIIKNIIEYCKDKTLILVTHNIMLLNLFPKIIKVNKDSSIKISLNQKSVN